MQNNPRKSIYTTVSIDKETGRLIEKICKRYSLKKSEVVKLAFGYIDKAHINPADVINNQGKQIGSLLQLQKNDNARLLKLISVYSELATCGVIPPTY
ncbi:MAG: hypothetical protein LBS04_02185 [Tannerellaceae bacterium]|jgi:hypothetical protein|nr:hypothetical protein [Tannerellaceae bacterium]